MRKEVWEKLTVSSISFCTNQTLMNARWCVLFKVGSSLRGVIPSAEASAEERAMSAYCAAMSAMPTSSARSKAPLRPHPKGFQVESTLLSLFTIKTFKKVKKHRVVVVLSSQGQICISVPTVAGELARHGVAQL